jgi:hypothetical protein
LGSKAFPGMKNIGQDRDPVALAWYNDATGEGEVGPEKPNVNRRYDKLIRKVNQLLFQ